MGSKASSASSRIQTAFWISSLIYAGMLAHVAFRTATGDMGVLTPFVAPLSLALFIAYMVSRPPERERACALAGGIALEWLRVYAMQAHGIGADMPVFWLCFNMPLGFGIGLGFAATLALWWRAVGVQHVQNSGLLVQVSWLMLVQVVLLYSMALIALIALVPYTYDDQLHRADIAFGVYIPALVGQWFERWPALKTASAMAYNVLAAALIVGYFLQQRLSPLPRVNLLAACVLAGLFAGVYFVVPGCGPWELFGPLFPDHVPMQHFAAYTLHPDVALQRNAMPSLHAVWALLLWINLCQRQPSRLIVACTTVYTALVLLATMGLGMHYFVDLVVAMPATVTVQALAGGALSLRAAPRWQTMLAGLAMMAAWLLLLCRAPELLDPLRAWALTALTLCACYILLHRVAMATERVNEKKPR